MPAEMSGRIAHAFSVWRVLWAAGSDWQFMRFSDCDTMSLYSGGPPLSVLKARPVFEKYTKVIGARARHGYKQHDLSGVKRAEGEVI